MLQSAIRPLTVALLATVVATAAHSFECAGCAGLSGSQTTTSGMNSVSVVVTVTNGDCGGTSPNCIGSACEVTVVRTWSLPPNLEMQFCTVRPPPQLPLCVYPPPNSGDTGTGSFTDNDAIRCGGYKVFTLETSSLSAQATGSCSSCQ